MGEIRRGSERVGKTRERCESDIDRDIDQQEQERIIDSAPHREREKYIQGGWV